MDYKTENTEKGKAKDRKMGQRNQQNQQNQKGQKNQKNPKSQKNQWNQGELRNRRKIGILAMAAIAVLIILGSICFLLLQNKVGSKGEWKTRGKEEETWNTRESLDTSRARSKRYEKLKKDYFPEDRPRGVSVWEEGVPACTLGDMYQSDLCAIITVTAGYEEDKNYFEAEAEQYIYDRTGRYADQLLIKETVLKPFVFYGRIPAEEGQRMVVFLDVDDYGICIGKLIWNYFVSEDGYVVPMTEDYDDEREEDEEYVGMWDYGGYALEDYLAVLQNGYHIQERQERKKWAIYEYLGHALELSVVQKLNGPKLVSAWEIVSEETERFEVIALAEEIWVKDVLQQAIGSGTLTLKREGNDYTVLSDTIVWNPIVTESGQAEAAEEDNLEEEQTKRLEQLAWENYEEWKRLEREENRYERIRAFKEVKPVGITSRTEWFPLELADHTGMSESDDVRLTLEYPAYPLGTGGIYGILENTGEAIIYYGSVEIEVWKEGIWYSIPHHRGIGQLLMQPALTGRTESGFGENLRSWEYDFPQGRYRIVVGYYVEDGRPSYEKTYDHMVCAEFELRVDVEPTRFGKLSEQSQKEKQAIKDGCVVLQNGTYRNREQAEAFFRKAALGIPCRMRLVDNDRGIVQDITSEGSYRGGVIGKVYTVTTRKGGNIERIEYPFLDIKKREGKTALVFTTYNGLKDSDSLGANYMIGWEEKEGICGVAWPEEIGALYPWDSMTVLPQPQGGETKWFSELAEKVRKNAVSRHIGNLTAMVVPNRAATRRMALSYLESWETAGLDLYGYRGSPDLLEENYPLQKEHPIYIFPVGETDFGVLFRKEDGGYFGRCYCGEDGKVIKTVEGSRESIVQQLRREGK